MCPALGQGYFMGALDSVAQKFGRRTGPGPIPGPSPGPGPSSLWRAGEEGGEAAAMVPVPVSGHTGE